MIGTAISNKRTSIERPYKEIAMPSDLPTPEAALRAVSAPEHNPLGTAGLEFVEFASRDPQALGDTFTRLGFKAIARHISKDVTLYRQGEMNFLINAEPDSFAARYAEEYGAGICAIGIRVADAQRAFDPTRSALSTALSNWARGRSKARESALASC